MDIISSNLQLIAIIILVGIVITYALIIRPYLKQKGYIKKDDLIVAGQLLTIVKLLVVKAEFNQNFKEKTQLIFDLTIDAINYIKDTIDIKNTNELKELSKQAVIDALNKLKIEVNKDDIQLIENTLSLTLDNVKIN